jgi:ADP-heptose:LPS heptosyltransferase
MNLSFLRALDRRLGLFFLHVLTWPMRFIAWGLGTLPRFGRQRFIFLKLKGGGSLIVAMPALMGLRRRHLGAEFILVCTTDAKIYAELTGAFDRYIVIDDTSVPHVIISGIAALLRSFRANVCIDLEPNSMMAGLFAMLSCAKKRIGLVRPQESARATAYSDAIPFDPLVPIYRYYDLICTRLDGKVATAHEARVQMESLLPTITPQEKKIGLAAFTSDFARERMMPPEVWGELMQRAYGEQPVYIVIFGSPRNRAHGQEMEQTLATFLPQAIIENKTGSGGLAQAAAEIASCIEIWAVDSGLLHIARLLGVKTHSFWGPTAPDQRLRPIAGLNEETHYRKFACSPCIQLAAPPCGGNNLCMITMAQQNPDLSPLWATQRSPK